MNSYICYKTEVFQNMSQNEKTSKNTTLVEHFQNTIGISRKDAKSQLIAYKDTTPHFP